MIDHDAIARAGHHPQYQRKTADGTIDHHHFVCAGRQPACGIASGNGVAQSRQAELIVTGQRKMLGDCGERPV